jgi:Spy/CpxP family protein refolding chaperone
MLDMKLTRHSAAAALIAACLVTTGASAAFAAEAQAPGQGAGQHGPDGGRPDGPGDSGPDEHGPHDGPHGFGGPGPGAPGPGMPFNDGPFHGGMPPLHGVKLTEAQQDKLFAIMHAQEPQRRDHGKAIRKAEQALRELGHADKFDDAKASALARDLGQAIAAEALLEARSEAQVLAVLTPEQRAQLHQRREHGPMGAHDGQHDAQHEGQHDGAHGQQDGAKGQAEHPQAAPERQ